MAIVTVAQALKKLYKTIVGEDTKKNNPTKIIVELADHWPGADGGGGGGSSDFSTATVTFHSTAPAKYSGIYIPQEAEVEALVYANEESIPSDGYITIPLLHSLGLLAVIGADGDINISVSGNAEHVGNGGIEVTGDCTITISSALQ